jgi:hypothetical protein
MSRLARRVTFQGSVILLIIGVAAGIAMLSGRGSATGDAGTLVDGNINAKRGKTTSRCGIGDAPAAKMNRVSGPMGDLVAAPIVIGCGRRDRELVQLVAFRTTSQLCAEMERPSKLQSVGGVCKPVNTSWSEQCSDLCIGSVLPFDIGQRRGYGHTALFGEASPERTSIKAVLDEPKGARAVPVIEGRVESPELLEALQESEPFVVFGTMVRPCVPPQSIDVVATGKGGVVRRHGVMSFPHFCVAPRPPS